MSRIRLVNSWKWLESNFSLHHHSWINFKGHESNGSDHQFRKLLIVKQILLIFTLESIERTVWRILVLTHCFKMVKEMCEDLKHDCKIFKWPFISAQFNNTMLMRIIVESIYSQDLISNSLYYLQYNSYDVIMENLVSDQPVVPNWYFSLFPLLVYSNFYWCWKEEMLFWSLKAVWG